ncbi:hypothetical protein A3J23_02015 [Candidatus Peregrinibacteria bacterium RIFCSPLOWO2_02_FULL_48_14]|nr:MAG: hypothetical protein A2974_02665 [Candidatus Peregrinibacteria bacterium RIFCSPLOWO2_01_FULL_48_20]OGJ46388.1 MAG: hypothetical protein A3J23_02015 [Candidatus Peregrinibacteria bacterium RIFCSPLOWO2_02_FULL_48_14]
MEQLFYITTKNKAEAKKIGRVLVKEKLATCINCWGGVDSVYWWKGKIEETKEGVLLVKTTEQLKRAVVKRIKELHSYEEPSIIGL